MEYYEIDKLVKLYLETKPRLEYVEKEIQRLNNLPYDSKIVQQVKILERVANILFTSNKTKQDEPVEIFDPFE